MRTLTITLSLLTHAQTLVVYMLFIFEKSPTSAAAHIYM